MKVTYAARALRTGVDRAPPASPTCALILPASSVDRASLSSSSFTVNANRTPASFGRLGPVSAIPDGKPNQSQANSSALVWGSALASKARQRSSASSGGPQRPRQQPLETVEPAAVVTPDGPGSSSDNKAAAAAASGGPVVVVHPQEPSPLAASQQATARRSAVGAGGSSTSPPPPVTFVRPTGSVPRGGSAAAAGIAAKGAAAAAAAAAFRSRQLSPGADPRDSRATGSSSKSRSGISTRNVASVDPFANPRTAQQPRSSTATQSFAVPPWLAAANKRVAGSGDGGGTPASLLQPSPTASTRHPTAAASAAATATVAIAAAAATAAEATASTTSGATGGDASDMQMSVSFSQVMGRQKRDGKGQASGQNPDPDPDVVDFTWEPDPELDMIEAEAAAAVEAEARRREAEARRDPGREQRERREAAEAAVHRSYAPGAPPPPAFVGSVKARKIPGRGFGLVATEDLAAGQLLLVSLPAVTSSAPPDKPPPMRPLLSGALRLLRAADGIPSAAAADGDVDAAAAAADGRALASLFWGAPRPTAARPPADLAAWRSRQQELLTAASPAAAASGGGGAARMTRVMSLLQLNLVAEGTQDGAATLARSEPLASVTGIWPEVALLNHSCAPNAVAVLLHDRLVVRAARRVPQGREVLLNWLGAQGGLMPSPERRKHLSEMYRFQCRCARCQLESSESVSLPYIYSDAERESEEALEVIEEALQTRDLEALTLALQPLQEAVAQLTDAVQLLSEQVDLTGGREGAAAAALLGAAAGGEEDDGLGEDGAAAAAAAAAGVGGGSVLAAAQQMAAAREAAAKRQREREGTGAGSGGDAKKEGEKKKASALSSSSSSSGELAPLDSATAETWLLGGMMPLHRALVDALSYRAAWLGMDLGPGWHCPPEPAVAVPASSRTAAAAAAAAASSATPVEGLIVVEDAELEEQQAEAMAGLIGSLASYVDVVGQLLPGSDAHIHAAIKLHSLSRRFLGPMDRVARDINTATYDAFVLRYGELDDETFERLLAAGIEALNLERQREAQAAERGAAAELEAAVATDATEALEALFLEDQRIREAHAANANAAATAAAAARARATAAARAAAAQPPRSWPLRGLQGGGTSAAKEEEDAYDNDLDLPEGISGGAAAGGGRSRRNVMQEAEEDLARILGASPWGPRSGPGSQRPRGAAAEADGGEEAEAVRRLFRRDAARRTAAGGNGDGAAGTGGSGDGHGEDGPSAQPTSAGEKRMLPQQKFESSLNSLLNVFPGLKAGGDDDGHDVGGGAARG